MAPFPTPSIVDVTSPLNAFVVASPKASAPCLSNCRLTAYPVDWSSLAASAFLTLLPSSTTVPSASLNSSLAVLPINSIASSGSSTSGISTLSLFCPSMVMVGSPRPLALIRFSITVCVCSMASRSSSSDMFSISSLFASITTYTPPLISRPRLILSFSGVIGPMPVTVTSHPNTTHRAINTAKIFLKV